MDYAADADALAAAFLAVTPPAGLDAIREATADPPAAPGPLPAVYVFLDDSDMESGNGTRIGRSDYLARFLLTESADLPRDARRLLLWSTVLADALKPAVQLGGQVALALVQGVKPGLIPYAGRTYAGVDVRVHIVTSESWAPTA